jgi:Ca-activated chloride channel homolog
MIASFESSIFVDADFTNDRAKLTKAILRTHTGGGTRLYDAVDLVLTERLNRIQGRKAVVLFSDGIDSTSKIANVQSNLGKIEESNALFYPIHYNTLPDASNVGGFVNGKPIPMSPQQIESAKARIKETSDRSIMYMSELAIRSGGRFYEAENMTDAKAAFANIAEELRRQYWLSYYSTNPKDDGSYRKIHVAVTQPVNAPTWAVRAKNGYRAPKK